MSAKFAAKILLFGEYGIITGGKALAVTLPEYSGTLCFPGKNKQQVNISESNRQLSGYINLLKSNPNSRSLVQIEKLEADIADGLYFDSNIPVGYGLGSSGALVAAIYHNYRLHQSNEKDLKNLQYKLSVLERPFHGKSSGLDPLVSYLNSAILTGNNGLLIPLDLNTEGVGDVDIFLIDTGRKRNTGKLVEIFNRKLLDPDFSNVFRTTYSETIEKCINDAVTGNLSLDATYLHQLSLLQFRMFSEMIPDNMTAFWISSLKERDPVIKLCGAGGGGFLLGITRDFNKMIVAKKDMASSLKLLSR